MQGLGVGAAFDTPTSVGRVLGSFPSLVEQDVIWDAVILYGRRCEGRPGPAPTPAFDDKTN